MPRPSLTARTVVGRLLRGWRVLATLLLVLGILGAILSMPGTWRRGPPLRPEQVEASIPERWQPLVGSIRAWQNATQDERSAFLTWALDVGLEVQRAKASAAIQHHQNARIDRARSIAVTLFVILMALSLLVLLTPFFLSRERVPHRMALWGHTVLATGTLVLSLLLLMGCVLLLLQVTGLATAAANPEQGLLDAGFDELRRDMYVALGEADTSGEAEGAMPYGPLIGAGEAETPGGYITNILNSLQYFDPESFKPALVWTHRTWTILSYVPLVVPFLVVLVILLTMRTTLLQILRMPLAAARGEKRSGRRALGVALRFVGLELLAVLSLIVALFPAGLLTSLAVRHLSRHVIAVILAQTETTVVYFGQLGAPPDQDSLAFGMLAVPAFLAIATLMGTGGLALFALRSRRLLLQRFHFGWPLRREEKLWRRSFMAMLRLQWIPALLMGFMAPHLVAQHARTPSDAAEALGQMTATGAQLALALPIVFVLFGGLGALRRLWPFARLRPAERGAYAVRAQTVADAAFLKQAHHDGLRAPVEATWGWDEAVQDGFMERWLDEGTAQVVLVDGKPAGYLEVVWHETHVMLANIVLIPTYQRRGIGTRIVQDLIDEAAAKRLPVKLSVLLANPARTLYERLGFRTLEEDEFRAFMLRPLPPEGTLPTEAS